MNIKAILTLGAVLLIVAVVIGVGYKIVQTTESQKADSIVNHNYDFHPMFGFGCMRVPTVEAPTPEKPVKKEVIDDKVDSNVSP